MRAGKPDESNDDKILVESGRARAAEAAWRRGMARVARRQRIRRATARPRGATGKPAFGMVGGFLGGLTIFFKFILRGDV
jgi:hypothetical protein